MQTEINPHSDLNTQVESNETRIPVLVTTEHKGVFFGFADPSGVGRKDKITLTKVRNCIYWSNSVAGFLGLAATGPDSSCRIGAEAPEVILYDITSVTKCTPEAVASWSK